MAYIVPPAVTRASSRLNLESALHSDTGLQDTGYEGIRPAPENLLNCRR